MTFLQIRQRIAELMGLSSIDTTPDDNATMETKFKEWVNARYKVLAAKESWNWLIKDFIIQTVTEITTGTVTATNGDDDITFSSGPTSSVANYFIQFSDSSDWYQVSSHTASATAAVLTTPYLGTTSSTLTYTLRKVYYTLPSDTGKILNIRQSRSPNPLTYVPMRQLDRMIPNRTQRGNPQFYTISGIDSNRLYKMEVYPVPSTTMNLNGKYFKIITELSSDSDIPEIPEAYHEILVWDVLSTYGYTFLDDTRISSAKAEYNSLYKDMKKNHVDVEDIAVRLAYDVDLTRQDLILKQLNLPIS